MSPREQKIQAYLDAFRPIEALVDLSPALLTFRPDLPEAWTIHENLVHLFDADLNGTLRLRKAFGQSGTPVVTYDAEDWAKNLNYHQFPVASAVALTKTLRELNAALLRGKLDADWTATVFSHPDLGLVSVDKWLEIYIGHVGFHTELIERNRKLFRG